MLSELKAAMNTYQEKWQQLVDNRSDKTLFAALQPTAVGWKTTNLADLDKQLTMLRPNADQIHFGLVNERWIAVVHLNKTELPMAIKVVKLMQRRSGSTDACGLDHVDFMLPTGINMKTALLSESDLKWTQERRGNNRQWLSIWFSGTEAKLRTDTVLAVCINELKDCQQTLLGGVV